MDDNVLETIKKMLGIVPEVSEFDQVLIVHINTAFNVLYQIGAADSDIDFIVEGDEAKWSDYIQDTRNVQMLKSFVYYRVRLAFDPPTSGPAISSFEKQATELEFRLSLTESLFNPELNSPDPLTV